MRSTLFPVSLRFKSAVCSALSEISFKHLKSPEFARMDKKATTTAAGAFWVDSDRSHGSPGDDIHAPRRVRCSDKKRCLLPALYLCALTDMCRKRGTREGLELLPQMWQEHPHDICNKFWAKGYLEKQSRNSRHNGKGGLS